MRYKTRWGWQRGGDNVIPDAETVIQDKTSARKRTLVFTEQYNLTEQQVNQLTILFHIAAMTFDKHYYVDVLQALPGLGISRERIYKDVNILIDSAIRGWIRGDASTD